MNHAESVLYAHLTEPDSLDFLALEGFTLHAAREVIPTEAGRKIVGWSLDYFFANGRKVAPSRDAILQTWGDEMEATDISLGDDTETDSIEWAVSQLRSTHVHWKTQEFQKHFAANMAKADSTEKVDSLLEAANELYKLTQTVTSRRQEADLADGFEMALQRYIERAEQGHITQGLTFGLDAVDEFIHGVHPGEVAVVAAASGVGKSWVAGKTALHEWNQNRRAVLFTLENSLEMTFDRLACMQSKVDYERWQIGECHDDELDRVKLMHDKLIASERKPIIIMPEHHERTALAMVRKAAVLDADSIIIDQLTFVNCGDPYLRDRWRQFEEIMRELKREVSNPAHPMPCLLLHQINREGIKEARKSGHYEMEHMAGGAEIERTADFVFGIYQNPDDKAIQQAQWQFLKSRRTRDDIDWLVTWRLDVGHIKVLREMERDG